MNHIIIEILDSNQINQNSDDACKELTILLLPSSPVK